MPDTLIESDRVLLRDSARRFLARACPPALVRESYLEPDAVHRRLWPELVALGWPALAIPQAFDGVGADCIDLCVIAEETGRTCMPGPFFSSSIVATGLLQAVATEQQKSTLLPRLARGGFLLTTAINEGAGEFDIGSFELYAERTDGGYRLQGRKRMVAYAALADELLCVARLGTGNGAGHSVGVFRLGRDAAGLSLVPLREMTGLTVSDVVLDGVVVEESALLGGHAVSWGIVRTVLLWAAVVRSAQMVGGAQRAMDIAIDHARQRRQFGREIGAFQAVQHHCANMLMYVETARRMVIEAASETGASCERDILAARTKVWCNRAYRETVRLAHQVLGGVGYMQEHEMPMFFRHARETEGSLGDTDSLLDIVADGLYGVAPP